MRWLGLVFGLWLAWRLSAPKGINPIYEGLPECEVAE